MSLDKLIAMPKLRRIAEWLAYMVVALVCVNEPLKSQSFGGWIVKGLFEFLSLVVGGIAVLAALGVGFVCLRLAPQLRRARRSVLTTTEVPDDPEGLRQALRDLAAKARKEASSPTPSAGTSQNYALAMQATRETFTPEQRAALAASDALVSRACSTQLWRVFVPLVASALLLLAIGLMAWLLPVSVRWVVLLIGGPLLGAVGRFISQKFEMDRQKLMQRQEEADVKVAQAMEEPSDLLTALHQLAECDRVQYARAGQAATVSSFYTDRRHRLARRLGGE